MYGYEESMEQGVEPERLWEDSPDFPSHYHGVYGCIVGKRRVERKGGCDVNLCRTSLITESLVIAADGPRCRNEILRKMVHEIWTAAGQIEKLKCSLKGMWTYGLYNSSFKGRAMGAFDNESLMVLS